MKNKTFKTDRRHQACGFTLIECMMAALFLMMILAGIMVFRYYTVFSAELAENQLLAARAASLLSESWKGQSGDLTFDPLQQDFDADFQISKLDTAQSELYTVPMGLSSLGNYQIQLDGKAFKAQLLYGSMWSINGLRSLHVYIRWEDHQGDDHEYYLPTLSSDAV